MLSFQKSGVGVQDEKESTAASHMVNNSTPGASQNITPKFEL